MATYRVWNSGADGVGSSWTADDTINSLEDAVENHATAANDVILVHKAHSETLGADATITSNANHTPTNPLKIVVVDKDDSDTPVDDYTDMGANEINAGSGYAIDLSGDFYFWGIRLVTGDSSAPFSGDITFENSEYEMDSNTTEGINTGAASKTTFVNSKLTFTGTGLHYVNANGDGGQLRFFGGSITAVTDPAQLFKVVTKQGSYCIMDGTDLSGIDPTSSWSNIDSGSSFCCFEMENCYLPASPPALGNSDIGPQCWMSAVNCGGTDGRYYSERIESSNSLTHDTTTHRDGGAEYDGTNGYSFNVITAGVTDGVRPFRQLLAVLDAGSLSGKDLEIHITHDNTDNTNKIQDDEIWAEFHALDDTSGVHWETTRSKPTATPADLAASTETWTSGKAYTQKISHTWAAGATSGLVYCYICVAKAFAGGSGDDVFICPKVEVV